MVLYNLEIGRLTIIPKLAEINILLTPKLKKGSDEIPKLEGINKNHIELTKGRLSIRVTPRFKNQRHGVRT